MKDGRKAAIVLGAVALGAAGIFLATRAEAAPPTPPEGIYCPYCPAGPFTTLDEINLHITLQHPGERLLTHIIWT